MKTFFAIVCILEGFGKASHILCIAFVKRICNILINLITSVLLES